MLLLSALCKASTVIHVAYECREGASNYHILVRDSPCSPTPVFPAPVSPTLDQKVAFCLLVKKQLYVTF